MSKFNEVEREFLGEMIKTCAEMSKFYGTGDTNTSAEGYFQLIYSLHSKKFPKLLKMVRKLRKYCFDSGIFVKTEERKNVFKINDPSAGFTGWNKTHAWKMWFYKIDRVALRREIIGWK